MRTFATWLTGGKSPRIQCNGSGYPPRSTNSRWASKSGAAYGYGLSQVGDLAASNGPSAVRDGQPLLTPSAPTVAAQPPGWTSPSGYLLRSL